MRSTEFRHSVLVRIADNLAYPRERSNFPWRALRVASRYNDLRFGILAVDAANRCPRVAIGCRRDRAGVQDNQFSLHGCHGSVKPPSFELTFDRRAVGLRRPAPEILHIESCHASSVT